MFLADPGSASTALERLVDLVNCGRAHPPQRLWWAGPSTPVRTFTARSKALACMRLLLVTVQLGTLSGT